MIRLEEFKDYKKLLEATITNKAFRSRMMFEGIEDRDFARRILKYIKLGLVDYIASDIHFSRKNYMEKAYEIINKKFGPDVANDLFNNNALELISEDERKEAI